MEQDAAWTPTIFAWMANARYKNASVVITLYQFLHYAHVSIPRLLSKQNSNAVYLHERQGQSHLGARSLDYSRRNSYKQ